MYHTLAMKMVAKDLLVFGHDHVGHGRSEGDRASIKTKDQWSHDVNSHCKVSRGKTTPSLYHLHLTYCD